MSILVIYVSYDSGEEGLGVEICFHANVTPQRTSDIRYFKLPVRSILCFISGLVVATAVNLRVERGGSFKCLTF